MLRPSHILTSPIRQNVQGHKHTQNSCRPLESQYTIFHPCSSTCVNLVDLDYPFATQKPPRGIIVLPAWQPFKNFQPSTSAADEHVSSHSQSPHNTVIQTVLIYQLQQVLLYLASAFTSSSNLILRLTASHNSAPPKEPSFTPNEVTNNWVIEQGVRLYRVVILAKVVLSLFALSVTSPLPSLTPW